MKFGSVCSGIEAASVAWHPLGWKAAWLAEIEPFPSAVLAHHYPEVPNLGDMTKIADMVTSGAVDAPDVLVGGTPCQAFSVAGLRNGLSDDRGFLTIKFVELADAIDNKRKSNGLVPAVVVWENVPGVLSSKDNAFGCFLAALAGEDEELKPAGKKWSNAGCVFGPSRTIAWRVLDAQYFGVAQRRRRVFVVASAREDFDPTAVLFESDGVRRDTAPGRESRTVVAALTANGVGTCGADDNQGQAGHLIPDTAAFRMVAFGEYADDGTASTMKARDYKDATDLAVTTTASGQESLTPWEKQGTRIQGVGGVAPTIVSNPAGGMKLEPIFTTYGIPGNWIGRAPENGGNATEPIHNVAHCQTVADRHGVAYGLQVRRLTPVECERLQGFPDNYTLITIKGKLSSDGSRYKALGNSMAVPVMRWIGERIIMHSSDE